LGILLLFYKPKTCVAILNASTNFGSHFANIALISASLQIKQFSLFIFVTNFDTDTFKKI